MKRLERSPTESRTTQTDLEIKSDKNMQKDDSQGIVHTLIGDIIKELDIGKE